MRTLIDLILALAVLGLAITTGFLSRGIRSLHQRVSRLERK